MIQFSKFRKRYLREARDNAAVYTFGRMNPPTTGHEKLIQKLIQVAKNKGAEPILFLSRSQDAKKNPLSHRQKVSILKKAYPQLRVVEDLSVRTAFDAGYWLRDNGYTIATMVVGSDRVPQFKSQMAKYIKHEDPKKSFDFRTFEVVSAGERDPDAEGVSGMSASKMREFVKSDDFESFKSGLIQGLTDRDAQGVWKDIKKGMGL